MGPNPTGIILEGLLAFPGVILNVKGPLFEGDNVFGLKFDWQADKKKMKRKVVRIYFYSSIYPNWPDLTKYNSYINFFTVALKNIWKSY